MKKYYLGLLLGVALIATTACEKGMSEGKSSFSKVKFNVEVNTNVMCKSGGAVDVSDFTFVLKTSDGVLVDSTKVGALEKDKTLEEGNYFVEVWNRTFEKPAFDAEFYYASSFFQLRGEETQVLDLVCSLNNAGVSVEFSDSFKEQYASMPYSISITDTSKDSLVFDATTTGKWGYFNAGSIKVNLFLNGTLKSSFFQSLEKQTKSKLTVLPEEIVFTPITPNVEVNDNVTNKEVTWKIGKDMGNNGIAPDTAFSLDEINTYFNILEGSSVWVKAYIVGGKISSGKVSFGLKDAGTSHVALATSASEQNSANCFALELPSSSDARKYLALADNPAMLGRLVKIKAIVTDSYLGLRGFKGTSEVSLE